MKIEAQIEFSDQMAERLERSFAKVDIDEDYVDDNEPEIKEWALYELEEMFGITFKDSDFEVTNMKEIMEDISYSIFIDKTN